MNEFEEFDSEEVVKKASGELLQPSKSRKYEKQYEVFVKWCKDKGIEQYTEDALLTFFVEKSSVFRSSTLWSHFSMLKATLMSKNEVDISKFTKVLAFLKRLSQGYEPKKSETLTAEQVDQFLVEAPDDQFLMTKVALILGITGACNRHELVELSMDDYTDLGSSLLFNVKNRHTQIERPFIVKNSKRNTVDIVELCKKYIAIRKVDTIKQSRFFCRYADGKCVSQPVGINTFGKLPQRIATFLKLPNASSYTAHCFRRTSASLLTGSAANADVLKKLWKLKASIAVEGSVENFINNTFNIADKMVGRKQDVDVDNWTISASSDTTSRLSNLKNSQQSLLIQELQSSSDSLELTEDGICPEFCIENVGRMESFFQTIQIDKESCVICNYCKQEYSRGGENKRYFNTSNLTKHLKRCRSYIKSTEFLPTTCLAPSPRSATQTAAASEENDLQHFIKLCAKFLPQSLMQFVKEQALLHKRKTEDSRVRGQKRKNDGPEHPSFHMSKTRYVNDIGDNGAENCENLATEEIAIVEGNLIQLDDYNFDGDLDVKEEELLVDIKTEPVDENDAPNLEDPLAITTSPNSLAENQYKKKDLQAPTHRTRKKTNAAKLTKSVFDQVWRTPSAVILPSPAWACQLIQSSTKNVISIAKMGLANDTPIVERSIVLDDTSVQVFVANKRVRSSVLDASSITSVVELQSFVRAVDSLSEVCGEVVVRGGA